MEKLEILKASNCISLGQANLPNDDMKPAYETQLARKGSIKRDLGVAFFEKR